MYRLIFQSGPQRGRRIAIRQGPVILGRHPDCTIRLSEPEVALQHAILENLSNGGVRIRRLTEGASLRINRQEISTAELRDGDVFEIGGHGLEFHSGTMLSAPIIDKPAGRSVGWLQRLTILAVGSLLTCQMIFLLAISVWHQGRPSVPEISQTSAPPPAVAAVSSNAAPTGTPSRMVLPQGPKPLPLVANTASNAALAHTAAVTAATETVTFSNELKKMQNEIGQLRQAVEALPKPAPVTMLPAATNVPAAVTAMPKQVVQPTNAALEMEDLVLAQAQRMFKRTLSHAAQMEPEQFDAELERIQTMAPDFLPPYLERAAVLEKRGLLAEATAQWQQVRKHAPGADLQGRADKEINRLEKVAAMPPPAAPKETPPAASAKVVPPAAKVTKPSAAPPVVPPVTPPAVRSARLVAAHPVAYLVKVDAEKLLAGENYDELRLLRITVGATAGAPPLPPADIAVTVTFFDRGGNSGRVAPSRAVVPGTALRATAVTGATLEFSATYQVPRGSRESAARQTGELWRYFGYRVELFYDNVLQERREQPADLLPAP